MTQEQTVKKHLEEHGSITPLSALNEYSIMRLSARINNLRNDGLKIDTVMISTRNKFNVACTHAKYVLKGHQINMF